MMLVWSLFVFVLGLSLRGNRAAGIVVLAPAPTSVLAAGRSCWESLPEWVRDTHASSLANAFKVGSNGLTDKSTSHNYHIMYHRYLSWWAVWALCGGRSNKKPRFRMLEIGLGCAPGGGMVRNEPGGSALAWKHLFPPEQFELDLHTLEFDASCAAKWENDHPGIVTKVHTGDATDPGVLNRVLFDSGGEPFDLIIDDGSHLNEHQIASFEYLIKHVAKGGVYVIEDIQSSCKGWAANTGTKWNGLKVEGTKGCMKTKQGEPTIFAKLVEWQKPLLIKRSPFQDVTSIDIQFQAAVISKQY